MTLTFHPVMSATHPWLLLDSSKKGSRNLTVILDTDGNYGPNSPNARRDGKGQQRLEAPVEGDEADLCSGG